MNGRQQRRIFLRFIGSVFPVNTVLFLLAVVTMPFLAGCRSSSAPRHHSSGTNSEGLPPAGSPVVGETPPMPEPEQVPQPDGILVETLVQGLVVPWDLAVVDQSRIYITERQGRVRLVVDGNLETAPYAELDVSDRGEGGLMGIALHPDYPEPASLFVMYTYQSGDQVYNRVSRFTDTGEGLEDEQVVVDQIPGGTVHNGGIVRFGPDGLLYVGTGEAGTPELAQDRSSLGGKILRVGADGQIPQDNPDAGSKVYAYGFRNVQGLAWHPQTGELWATNHGPSGEFGLRAKDSVFIVRPGGNHGWPRVLGVTDVEGVVPPVLFFPNYAVPPAGATFYTGDILPQWQGSFLFASLRGEHLHLVSLSEAQGEQGSIARLEMLFADGIHSGRYGRLRAVVQAPDGSVLLSTSNRDGRGTPQDGDDRILRISSSQ